MRICYLSRLFFPSAAANAIQTLQMCQAMAEAGHDVCLVAPQRDPASPPRIEWSQYGMSAAVPVHFQASPQSPAASPRYAWAAARWAARSGFDLIFTRNLHCAIAALLQKVPTIVEFHALQGGAERFYVGCLRWFRSAKRVVAISEGLKQDFVRTYPAVLPANQIVVAHDGVDVRRFRGLPDSKTARRTLDLPTDGLWAGYCGHMYQGRGLFEVVLPLAARCPDIRFLLVGGTAEDGRRLAEYARLHSLHNVCFKPHVPNSEVPLHLAACDALLAPYQRRIAVSGNRGDTSRWTSPLKVFEYMASGRPMLVSALPVLREVLTDANSYLCEPDNLDQWETDLRTAVQDQIQSQRRARRAGEDVLAFTWNARVKRCLDGFPPSASG